ncbi:hypothetical protein GYH30_006542 [Glycine max]|nr:hypothetical protein GYH30_006542 [Glycine max]
MSRHWYWRVAQSAAVSLDTYLVPQLVLATPSHVSTILARASGGIVGIADAAGGIQYKTDPPAISFKRDPNP